ncbi:hypothetical protein [Altericroceibacterium endophyticum]|uniref:Proton-conducting membrane transporter n=1 Tax=Altericroceibacterium endophyticum TaxID=1808508 RepID=A0A6I4T1C6_9SPHN|nr:hypothetical protein [Altericroceibacterium endophyticum]MXO64994.1 hypothetical protein [Altericroceibacterium endophyticum]
MIELVQANWILFLIALVIGIAVAWWIFAASRKTTIQSEDTPDTDLNKPARRNQALIDAPPAASIAPTAKPGQSASVSAAGGGVESRSAAKEETSPDTAPVTSAATPDPLAAAETEPSVAASATPASPAPEEAPASSPAPAPAAATAPTEGDSGDVLTRIKGVGPKLEQQLQAMGITSFAQIAAWDDAEIDRVDAQLGRFQGRIRRDNWPEQARLLASDDKAAFESKFGKV